MSPDLVREVEDALAGYIEMLRRVPHTSTDSGRCVSYCSGCGARRKADDIDRLALRVSREQS